MAEIVPLKRDNNPEGEMDFEQALNHCGLQKSDLGESEKNAVAKYRNDCRKYWMNADDALSASKRKVEANDNRPKRERNYLPTEEALRVMRAIVELYGPRTAAQQSNREEELRRELEEIEAAKARIGLAKEMLNNNK